MGGNLFTAFGIGMEIGNFWKLAKVSIGSNFACDEVATSLGLEYQLLLNVLKNSY